MPLADSSNSRTSRAACAYIGLATLLALLLSAPAQADTPTIQNQQLLERIQKSDAPMILDVRSQREFDAGHVPGAVHIPVQELRARIGELESAKSGGEIVVYCERGGRAARAEALLGDAGFSKILHLEGDMSGWRRDGLPITTPPSSATDPGEQADQGRLRSAP